MPNRLASETSPYLLQHQSNPVDWYPWGDEAFEKAKAEDKPVFLSVGYSSCHWCHVMEHESFEDEEVADILNRDFVSVKVDREERPDVDEAYMTAVQLSSGRGGWPMSVFMTPDRKPFFAGTYFPKNDRSGYPGFMSVLNQISQMWRTQRRDVEKAAGEFAVGLEQSRTRSAPRTFTKLDENALEQTIRALASDYDPNHGGFGEKPKFPPHTSFELLFAYAGRKEAPEDLRQIALHMALDTLRRMAFGGIHDHVGGGFHRYSTDERWLLPHFEKMLYDNALLLASFSRAAKIAAHFDPHLSDLYQRTAKGIVDWAFREMRNEDGLFYSALDADSEGEEGKFYVWTQQEIANVLGDRSQAFADAYSFQPEGNFHDEATGELTGANIPHLSEDVGAQFAAELQALREAREARVRPGLDDKALIAWNGLMIAGLAEAGEVDAAGQAAERILAAREEHGALPHQITKGQPRGDAFLDGYAYFIYGLIHHDLAAGETRFESHARTLMDEMIQRFYDDQSGGFFMSSESHEMLFGRTKPAFDQPMPSPNAIAIRCLLHFGEYERAIQSVQELFGWMERAPGATESLWRAALPMVAPADAKPDETQVSSELKEVQVEVPTRELVASNGWAHGEIRLRIPEGVHINGPNPPARWLTPTLVAVEPLKAEIDYPAAKNDQYEQEVVIPFKVELPSGQSAAEFELQVTYQPCTDQECLLPVDRKFDCVVLRG
jgi:uncharacterized protein